MRTLPKGLVIDSPHFEESYCSNKPFFLFLKSVIICVLASMLKGLKCLLMFVLNLTRSELLALLEFEMVHFGWVIFGEVGACKREIRVWESDNLILV